MGVNFYNESSGKTTVKWQSILEKPQLVKSIESGENKLIIHYDDGSSEEVNVNTVGSGGSGMELLLSSREW